MNYDRIAYLYATQVRCPDCGVIVEEGGFQWPHGEAS